ncbi:hypothetical protein HWB57_gp160 [Erwinia phage vB_EamM-Bue1]|uniref:Uncharacterized protein n=1 Tax=Erwinia phage vB_EamM-Bue1 TaxID=2099338 RepID=A0A2P1JUI3_9CAUD|nr:hypothetical protein HWB57_gp160 [Erwinia phage vB_EamM-Bue1]AVO23012.1 hypothetical protein [Erwinia phage vB_EamM-Bue1]
MAELALGSVSDENIEYIKATGFKVTAFATEYEVEIAVVKVDSGIATSSLLQLENVKPVAPKTTRLLMSASLSEILEPGDNFPRFEALFVKI